RAYIRFIANVDASDGAECMISRMSSENPAEKVRSGTLMWHIPEIFREHVYDSPDLSRFLKKSDSSPEFWIEGLTQLPFFKEKAAETPVLIVEYVLPNRPYLLVVDDNEVPDPLQGVVQSIPFGPAQALVLKCPKKAPGEVSGRVFQDQNGDGVSQVQEQGWQEAELVLYHDQDDYSTPVARFRTGASGRFSWQADRTGTFLLRLRSKDQEGAPLVTTAREACLEIAGLGPQTVIPEIEFGMR
ncbi:MAG: hypothetical protein AAFV07_17585, partial [Bacteroidota bacterium]